LNAVVNLPLFVLAGLLLNLTPGPDVVYVVTHAIKQGVRAGCVAALGITAGCFVHIAAAALGVSALVAACATAFTTLKWIGAIYLVYVGWQMLALQRKETDPMPSPRGDAAPAHLDRSLRNVFLQGFWTNALNPKVALFFLAFVPQFILPSATDSTLAFLLLGLLFNLNGLWVNVGWAVVAATLADRLLASKRAADAGGLLASRVMGRLEQAAGVLFIGFGMKLALSDTAAH